MKKTCAPRAEAGRGAGAPLRRAGGGSGFCKFCFGRGRRGWKRRSSGRGYKSEDISADLLAVAAEEEEEVPTAETAPLCGPQGTVQFCEFSFANNSTFVREKAIYIRLEENNTFRRQQAK